MAEAAAAEVTAHAVGVAAKKAAKVAAAQAAEAAAVETVAEVAAEAVVDAVVEAPAAGVEEKVCALLEQATKALETGKELAVKLAGEGKEVAVKLAGEGQVFASSTGAALRAFVETAKAGDVASACKTLLATREGQVAAGGAAVLLLALMRATAKSAKCVAATEAETQEPQRCGEMTLTPICGCVRQIPVQLMEVVDEKGRRLVVASSHSEPFDIPIGTKVDEVNGVVCNTLAVVQSAVEMKAPTESIELMLGKMTLALVPKVEEQFEEKKAMPVRQSRQQSIQEQDFLRHMAETSTDAFVAVTLSPAREDIVPGVTPDTVLLTSGNPLPPNGGNNNNSSPAPPSTSGTNGSPASPPKPAAEAPTPTPASPQVDESPPTRVHKPAAAAKTTKPKAKAAKSTRGSASADAKPKEKEVTRVRKVVKKTVPVRSIRPASK